MVRVVGFFNGEETPHAARLEGARRGEEDLAILPIIATEVLQGFRTDHGLERAHRVLTAVPVFQPDLDTHVRAARLFRLLRRRGVTVRGTIECVIAQSCIDASAEVLSPDLDFEGIARHAPLRLWRP